MSSTQGGVSAGGSRVRKSTGNRQRKWIWTAAAIGILAVIALIAGVTWAVTRGSDDNARQSVVSGQPVPELSGRQAPSFTLMSAQGAPVAYAPYTYTPGDGKKHLFVFFMGYFWAGCRNQLGGLVKKIDELNAEAEVVAISVDPPEEMGKLNQLLGGRITLLTDPDLRVIGAFRMQHSMGSATVGNMGYAIVDGSGTVRTAVVDPLFGRNVDQILQVLEGI